MKIISHLIGLLNDKTKFEIVITQYLLKNAKNIGNNFIQKYKESTLSI
jgi:hypothetical protein